MHREHRKHEGIQGSCGDKTTFSRSALFSTRILRLWRKCDAAQRMTTISPAKAHSLSPHKHSRDAASGRFIGESCFDITNSVDRVRSGVPELSNGLSCFFWNSHTNSGKSSGLSFWRKPVPVLANQLFSWEKQCSFSGMSVPPHHWQIPLISIQNHPLESCEVPSPVLLESPGLHLVLLQHLTLILPTLFPTSTSSNRFHLHLHPPH